MEEEDPGKNEIFRPVENKGTNSKKAKKQKGELILGKSERGDGLHGQHRSQKDKTSPEAMGWFCKSGLPVF